MPPFEEDGTRAKKAGTGPAPPCCAVHSLGGFGLQLDNDIDQPPRNHDHFLRFIAIHESLGVLRRQRKGFELVFAGVASWLASVLRALAVVAPAPGAPMG